MKKIHIFSISILILASLTIFILTPVGEERSAKLAQSRFDEYCAVNRFYCTDFIHHNYKFKLDGDLRIYSFEYEIVEQKERIVFHVRVPLNELGKVTIGTKSDVNLVKKHMTK